MPRHAIFTLLLCVLLLVSSRAACSVPCSVEAAPLPRHQVHHPVGVPSFGVNAHLATRYPDPASMHVPGALLDALGVSWVREDFHWYRVQPREGVWDWTFNDAAVRALLRRDINILGVIGGPSAPWATPYRGDSSEYASFYAPNSDAFVTYARAVVTRYHRYIDHWEIWNEPDNELFWKPAPDATAYADMLLRTSAAIKEIDPDATILIGGINPFDSRFLREVVAAGAWESFDILAIHPYVDPFGPEESTIAAAADAVRLLADQYGQKPIWVTEVGWASGPSDHDSVGRTDEQAQAFFLVRTLLLLWESGVERSFWYTLKDDPDNPYGLVRLGKGRADYSQTKPAFDAFRTLNQQLEGAKFVERRDLFQQSTLLDFTQVEGWHRPVQPNGRLNESGAATARIDYHFSTAGNDYVVFELTDPLPLARNTHALGVWVYGDGSGHRLNVWVRDAEGEMLQFNLGIAGVPGWQFLSAPIVNPARHGDHISGTGNGRVDFPASFAAFVLDDYHNEYTGTGTVYLDNLTAISGREVYDMRFTQSGRDLDIIWSPTGARVTLKTSAAQGNLVTHDGRQSSLLVPRAGRFSLLANPAPVYLWHTR